MCPTVRERKFTLTFCSGVSALLFAFIRRENLEIEIITGRTWCNTHPIIYFEKKKKTGDDGLRWRIRIIAGRASLGWSRLALRRDT